ncbi:MAG: DUF1638 domain-containing protein [Desulfomonilaceae bacterium]
MATDNIQENGSIVVIGCEVMKAELEMVAQDVVQFHFLDQGLHRTPNKMATLIQHKIDLVGESAKRVIIAYGLCSGGINGIRAGASGLVVPRCHDCIALFFGSHEAYQEAFTSRPGTYYLTSGWVKAKKDPLGIIYDDYAPKHGIETAFWVMEEELKHYTHIALLDTGAGDLESLRIRTRENCQALKKEYWEIKGSLDYFRKLIYGPYCDNEFLTIPPDHEVTEEMFLGWHCE